MMMKKGWLCAGTLALASCTLNSQPDVSGPLPRNVTVQSNGLATLLTAPASQPSPTASPTAGNPASDEGLGNPDEASTRSAESLHNRLLAGEAGNYIGRHIVRDPTPRYAFQFRRDAARTLAKYTTDQRFVAREGGVPQAELQPIFDEWFDRLSEQRLVGGGSVQEFDGVVALDMTVDEPTFRKIATERGWVLPERLKLNFSPAPNPRSIDPALAKLVRIFPRSDRLPGAVNEAALTGRIILRDGCFRVANHITGKEPLVLFDRDAELGLDSENYLVLRDGPGHSVRLGEAVMWAGPRRANEADAGAKALREQCGDDLIIPIGSPSRAQGFPGGDR